MQKGNLTREKTIEIVGEENVIRVESENCEPTNRVGYNGECQGDALTEHSAAVRCEDADGTEVTLVAYYYTTNAEDQLVADTGDGSSIDWIVAGYEIY